MARCNQKTKHQRKLLNPEQKCLNCPKLHRNNNCYCSVECCEQHRQKKKDSK